MGHRLCRRREAHHRAARSLGASRDRDYDQGEKLSHAQTAATRLVTLTTRSRPIQVRNDRAGARRNDDREGGQGLPSPSRGDRGHDAKQNRRDYGNDRDRGTPRDVTPPTPPGIRVRTTAVRPVERSRHLEIGQPERVEVGAGERPAERRSKRHPPRTAIAAGREDGILGVDATLPQLTEARTGSRPLFPDDGPQPPPNPLVKTSENRGRFAEAEVRPPPEYVRGEFLYHLAQAHTTHASG